MAGCKDILSLWIFAGSIFFVSATIIRKPKDTEAVVESRVVIECSTSERYSINWEHTPVGERFAKDVYLSSSVIQPYDQRLKAEVNRTTGEYRLIIHSVQKSDAGRYECIDVAGQGERLGAELVVLDSKPQCQEHFDRNGILIDNDCGLDPEMIEFNCTLRYSGNNEPKLIWRQTGGNSINPRTTIIDRSQDQSIISAVIIPTLPMDGGSLTCETSWSNINWTSSTIKLLYVYNDSTIRRIDEPTRLHCKANTSQPCSYAWSHLGTQLSAEQLLDIDSPGIYICVAKCTLREHQCVANASVVEFIAVEANGSGYQDIPSIVVIIIAVGLLVLTGIFICIFLVRRNSVKKKGRLNYSSRILITNTSPSQQIQGIASVGNDLYILRRNETSIHVYSSDEPFRLRREIKSQELQDPRDIAASNRSLFITDAGHRCVWQMTTRMATNVTKFIKDVGNPFTISVNSRGEILMAQKPNELITFNSNGKVEQSIILGLHGITDVYHAIETSTGSIAMGVAFNAENNETRGVVLVSKSGEVSKKFVGKDSGVLYQPCHIATNESGSLYVAEARNNRIVILDQDLNPIQVVPSARSDVWPTRLQYKSGQLIVGQSNGTVQFIGDTYLEGLRISQASISSDENYEDITKEDSTLLSTK